MKPKRPTLLAALGGALFILGVLAALMAHWTLRVAAPSSPMLAAPPPAPMSSTITPQAPLEINPMQDLESLREKETGLLNRFRWADKSKGVVQIPIERAMEVTAKEGLPVRKSKEASPS